MRAGCCLAAIAVHAGTSPKRSQCFLRSRSRWEAGSKNLLAAFAEAVLHLRLSGLARQGGTLPHHRASSNRLSSRPHVWRCHHDDIYAVCAASLRGSKHEEFGTDDADDHCVLGTRSNHLFLELMREQVADSRQASTSCRLSHFGRLDPDQSSFIDVLPSFLSTKL